jgi:hypothetical protein
MKTPLVYGSLMALVGALLTYGLFFAGYHDAPEKLQVAQWIGSGGGILASIVFTALAMRERRAEYPANREWGYGSAFVTGLLAGLVGAVLGAILAYIYFAFVNPGFNEIVYQAQVAKMEAKGMSSAQIEQASGMMRKMMSPVVMVIFQVIAGAVWSTILSLIVAIFFRNRPAAAYAAEPNTPVA